MCGIWAYLTKQKKDSNSIDEFVKSFNKLVGRGPDNSIITNYNNLGYLGFHRLSIMDISDNGNQPFYLEVDNRKMVLICNGEIYNHKELINDYSLNVNSRSDCEVILHLYNKFGIDKLISLLDGVFAFLIIDHDETTGKTVSYACRDRIGVRPMFYGYNDNFDEIGFCSVVSGLSGLFNNINVFTPGTYMKYDYNEKNISITEYYKFKYEIENSDSDNLENVYMNNIKSLFIDSVKKRLISDRPICCLLSGGLDSSLVASVAARLLGSDNKLHTFSIGMDNATDMAFAKMVSDHIGSEHHIINITKQDALKSIRDVIFATETYDITTIRASVGQYLVSKAISDGYKYKVVLSGDGSDELTSGYLYNYNAPSLDDLHKEAEKRLKEIHLYDSLRADRATSIHGLELRVPFLDSKFVDYYMSIKPEYRIPNSERMEKYLLRKSFEEDNYLPNEVLYRKKEAFSDGISSKEESWYETIQKYIETLVSDEEYSLNVDKYTFNKPHSKESYYYRKVFGELFDEKYSNVIPEFWMPNWSGESKEPSARVLSVYSETKSNVEEL